MHLFPPRASLLHRGCLLLASVALLVQAGCAIPSDRYSGRPNATPAPRVSEAGCATCGLEESGGCLHGSHSPQGLHGAEAELPWPRFHPLPTRPLAGPADPGWP